MHTGQHLTTHPHIPEEMPSGRLLLGAVAGDIIGSVYEHYQTKRIDFHLFPQGSRFTDDTVMTIANADWLLNGGDLARIM